MFGVNGISLPASLAARGPEALNQLAGFNGLAPLSGLDANEIIKALPFGLAVIWLLPNTQQWMAKYQPAWDAVRAPSIWTWQLSKKYGAFGGALFALSLLMLTRESAFLYFQF